MGQTAVEWLYETLWKQNDYSLPSNILEKAKEMEKQNLYNFYIQGGIDCVSEADRTVEDYFNETFKSE